MADEQYLSLVKEVLSKGQKVIGRNGTTISLFSPRPMTFDLNEGFPILTTKKIPFRIIVEELLWFLRGEDNCKSLQEKGISIWDGNSSREFLDGRGFHDKLPGYVGPMYGIQWRNFEGVDQVAKLITDLHDDIACRRNGLPNPTARRHILTAWNPRRLDEMVIPPCHILTQFSIEGISPPFRLSAHLYQRSGDIGLGIPFNITSYATLIHLLCAVVNKINKNKINKNKINYNANLIPGRLIHTIGDAHIYEGHVEKIKEQFYRKILPTPKLVVTLPENICNVEDLKNLTTENFTLHGYECHPAIKMEMSA